MEIILLWLNFESDVKLLLLCINCELYITGCSLENALDKTQHLNCADKLSNVKLIH